MTKIAGSTVVVVGGGRGIGRATCRLLRDERCRVVVADRDEEALADLGRSLADIETVAFDMADAASVAAGLGAIEATAGRLDAVVVAAAVHGACPIEKMSDAFVERIITVNLVAHAKLVRDLLPLMKDGGRIVGISSNSTEVGIPMEAIYAASKAGMEKLYEALSIEASYRGIRPIVIQPGNVNTGFNESGHAYDPQGHSFVDEGYRRVVAAIDSRNGMDPDIVARAIVAALKASRPRLRYLVGGNAAKAHWARRILGTGLALRFAAQALGFRFFY